MFEEDPSEGIAQLGGPKLGLGYILKERLQV